MAAKTITLGSKEDPFDFKKPSDRERYERELKRIHEELTKRNSGTPLEKSAWYRINVVVITHRSDTKIIETLNNGTSNWDDVLKSWWSYYSRATKS